MKKLILLLSLILVSNTAFAYNYSDTVRDSVNVNQKINYSAANKTWARNYNPKDINFVKHMTVGSGGFSEFLHNKTYYDTNTTYEFFNGNKIIGHNMHLLKFFELGFDNKITQRDLSIDEIKALFPDVEIIKISQFKKNKIVVKKPFGEKRTYLLINDTNRDFYKYSFENYGNGTELIKGLFEVDSPKTLIFSHFGSRDESFPVLKIKVKNCIFAN